MDHLKDAREFADAAECAGDDALAGRHAQLAIAHALIAIAERLPPLVETASAAQVRLRKEEKDNGV